MHIFNIIQCANLGGMEQSTLMLLRDLKRRGHYVDLLSLNPLGGLGPLLAQEGIPAEGLAYRGFAGWRSLAQLRRRLAQIQSDALIMTGHNLMAMQALGDLCANRRVLSIHFHHAGVKPRWQWRLIYRAVAARFSAVMFPSDFIRREAEAIYPPIKPISHTVGCPIALSDLPSELDRVQARRSLGLPEGAHITGNAGWLIQRKRFDVFLHVARNIALADINAMFVIAGEGPESARLKSLADDLGITDRVRWLGWQTDLTSFYRSLDLLLFNADWEAMGRTPLEALAFGVPVVASVARGGLSEIINDDNYGPIFGDHDIDRLTDHALWILRDLTAARALVAAGRHRLAQAASVVRYTDQVLQIMNAKPSRKREAA
jgi:glycosyltransferase involved in cell wall biosynthesis